MPTTVTKSIGSAVGRDYATIQLWEDACPANLVTADQIWKGELYKDSEFVTTTTTTIAGMTTDTNRYIWLTTAPGQSFTEHPTAASNPLRYDASVGVGLRRGGGSGLMLDASGSSKFVLDNVQIQGGTTTNTLLFNVNGSRMNNCLVENRQAAGSGCNIFACYATNCLFIQRGASTGTTVMVSMGSSGGSGMENCTVVKPTDINATGPAIRTAYAGTIGIKNCAIFGFATLHTGNTLQGTGNNATDHASGLPGTNNVYSLTYADQFVALTDATRDFRVKAGHGLQFGASTTSTDIYNQTRASPSTVGAFEYLMSSTALSSSVFITWHNVLK